MVESTKDKNIFEPNWDERIDNFDNMGFSENHLRGIYSYGFEKPFPIQQTASPAILKKRDVFFQSPSGSGKTGALTLGLLQIVDHSMKDMQALLLAPHRELAQGISRMIIELAEYLNVKLYTCIGGNPIKADKETLKEGVQIVVGTPGRVLDMINRGFMKTESIKIMAFDELDEMLCRGFFDQISEIMKFLPTNALIACSSTTSPPEIISFNQKFLRDPAIIQIHKEELTVDGIKQFYVLIEKEEYKYETLNDLFSSIEISQCIIYCNTYEKVEKLTNFMNEKGFQVFSYSHNLGKDVLDILKKQFISGSIRICITSCVLPKALGIFNLPLVINFDLVKQKEEYVRRIGRSGAFGRKGCAITFVEPNETTKLSEIEKYFCTLIEELPLDLNNLI